MKIAIGLPLYFVAKTVKEDGKRVLLTGQGADELFGGYKRHETFYEKGQLVLDREIYSDLQSLSAINLERDDMVAMANSVELRVPFLDKEVIKIGLAISPELKVLKKDGRYIRKYILRKTAEYLLTRPITRSEIFVSKLSVVFMNVLILNLVTASAGFVLMELVRKGPFSISAFSVLVTYTFLLNILFGAIGLFLSTLMKRAKPITILGVGLVLILYFIYTLSKITVTAAKIGYLSPFRFANADVVNPAYSLGLLNLLYFVGISLLLTGLSYRIYLRKDIYT
jgi:hypothetical protein